MAPTPHRPAVAPRAQPPRPRDKAFATELAYGRHPDARALDHLLAPFVRGDLRRRRAGHVGGWARTSSRSSNPAHAAVSIDRRPGAGQDPGAGQTPCCARLAPPSRPAFPIHPPAEAYPDWIVRRLPRPRAHGQRPPRQMKRRPEVTERDDAMYRTGRRRGAALGRRAARRRRSRPLRGARRQGHRPGVGGPALVIAGKISSPIGPGSWRHNVGRPRLDTVAVL